MNHAQEFIKGFVCEAPAYLPPELDKRLCFLSCLSEKESRSVFLVNDNVTGQRCILKIADCGSPDSARGEFDILSNLDHPGIPHCILFTEDADGREYILRSYMEGDPLDCLLDRDGVFTETQIYDIVLKLCTILRYLHQQQPPIIYRDINPGNITLTANGKVSLIDFGISKKIRTGNEPKAENTVLVGTIPFISPEQMGFDKTDHRSDIFALGKLMLYLYTGQTDLKVDEACGKNTRLGRLIETCTRQSKERRYSSIKQLERAIIRAQKKPAGYAFIKGALLACAVVSTGFLLWGHARAAGLQPSSSGNVRMDIGKVDESLPLRSPELIAAVRQTLMISDDTPLTGEMLEHVTKISIEAGIQAEETGAGQKPLLPRNCLEELTYFNNLSELSVRGYRIPDLTPVRTIPLQTLRMIDCGISNISALDRMKRLEVLELSHNPIEDVRVLAGLSNLRSLDLSYTYVRDVSVLEKLPGLRSLNLCVVRATDLSVLVMLPDLETLKISHVQINDFSFLKNMTKLTWLELKSTGFQDLSLITSERIEVLDISMNYNYMTDISSLDRFSELRELDISMNEIVDYSPVYDLPRLQTLGINENQSEDLLLSKQRLMQMPCLSKIVLTAGELGEGWQSIAEQGRVTVVLRSYYEAY